MKKAISKTSVVVALCLGCASSFAELIYQPPPPASGTELDRQWRQAGADLFLAVAAINETFAQLELRQSGPANQKLEQAETLLRRAAGNYDRIAKAISNPRPVLPDKLTNDERNRLQAVERAYGIRAPQDEAEAAVLALAETRRLLEGIAKRRAQILKPDLVVVRDLLADVGRLQRVGAQTAVLMQVVQRTVVR